MTSVWRHATAFALVTFKYLLMGALEYENKVREISKMRGVIEEMRVCWKGF